MKSYGLIGEHLTHSFSPKLHEIIFKNADMSGEYNLFEVNQIDLKATIEILRQSEINGFNVTIPYKIEVLKYIEEISPEANMIGAVNTLDFKAGKIKGHNTDYYGFGKLLKSEDIDIKDKKSLILGTGGASKSVYHYLKDNGIKEIIFGSRYPEKAKSIYPDCQIMRYEDLNIMNSMDIIINTTPLGMYPNIDMSPVDKRVLSKFHTAIDLIYNPRETMFMSLSNEIGLKTSNGLYMLVAQGIKSQEIWNSREFDDEFYDKVYDEVKNYVD